MAEISETINKKLQIYDQVQVETNPTFARKQRDILELIDFYWMNRFRDSGNDSTGFKKAFFNVITPPTEVSAKMIDFDTKDIRIIAEDGQSFYPAWMMGKDLKIWMKDQKNSTGQRFGQFLNQIVLVYPKYGHLLAKKAKNSVHLVPIKNIRNQPDAISILASDLIIEEHKYTPYQLHQQGWDKVEKVIEEYEDEGFVKVLECHGDVGSSYNYYILPEGGKDLYKEVKWDNIPGRAMGRGQPERLFEAQIAKNQQEYWMRSGQRWSSKHIFQTKDDTTARNLINQIENGEVLTVLSEITPISVEERNLPAYNWLDNKWDKHIQELTFSYNQMKGERPPAGTPLGTSVLQTNLATQYFDLKREELGMFLKDILYDWVLPEFKKQKKNVHSLMLRGEFEEEELDRLRGLLLTNRTNKSILRYIANNMRIPSVQESELFKSIEKESIGKLKEIEIPKDYYKDLKYKIDIILTNEQIDVSARLTTLQTILQIIGSNPTILREPRTRKVFYKMIDLAGFSPIDFESQDVQSPEEAIGGMAEMGGSIARPQQMASSSQATFPMSV